MNDDSGRTATTEANGCGCYNPLFCDGGSSQTVPSCPSSCIDSECDASCHCDGTCEADLPNGSACDETRTVSARTV